MQLLDVVPLTCLKMSEYNMNIARSTSDLNRIFELFLCEVLQQEGERKAERKGKEKERKEERKGKEGPNCRDSSLMGENNKR